MHPISMPLQSFIKLLRQTEMPWIGDQIESHLQLGKIVLYHSDSQKRRTVTKAGEIEKPNSWPIPVGEGAVSEPTAEDLSEPYPLDAQIEEALKILQWEICGRVQLVDSMQKIFVKNFKLSGICLEIIDDDGKSYPLITEEARAEAERLHNIIPEIRSWLESGATGE